MERGGRLGIAGLTTAIALTAAIAIPPTAGAVAPNPNPWLQRHFLNMAHQGGEDEAPSNTLFAFKSAIRDRGADTIELDVNLSSDGELMVIHDDTWTRTSCTAALCPGPDSSTEAQRPASEVNDLTTDELQALDAGYWFRPGTYSHDYAPTASYPYRGIATGAVAPPAGYSASDFRIPTLREVLDAFPSSPINIEIKMIKTTTGTGGGCVTQNAIQYCDDPIQSMPVAVALADLLDEPQYATRNDIIVVSFSDALVSEFNNQDDGGNVALAPGLANTALYAFGGVSPIPDVAAFQVPPKFSGQDVPTLLLNGQQAHADGYAVHVWANGEEPESEASYARLIALGIDGYMSSQPSRLAAYLCANNVPRPDGTPRCPAQASPVAPVKKKKCKKKGKRKPSASAAKKKRKCKKRRKKRR
jgi:glycerophosphoryl diester phosphodiesterase